MILAGGQSLLPSLWARRAPPGRLVDVSRVDALKHIADEGGSVRIGAGPAAPVDTPWTPARGSWNANTRVAPAESQHSTRFLPRCFAL